MMAQISLTKVKAIECPATAETPEDETTTSNLPNLVGYSGVSIVDGLKSAGADSSYAYRKNAGSISLESKGIPVLRHKIWKCSENWARR